MPFPWKRCRRWAHRLWVTLGLGITFWMVWGFQAGALPPRTFQSTAGVEIRSSESGWAFLPTQQPRQTGLIFLPGGMVEPQAYAPLVRSLAEAGYPAELIRLPLRCGCTAAQIQELNARIQTVLASKPTRRWLLAGHSRGAMLAARFTRDHAPQLAGLALLGTTHPRDFDLSSLPIPVLKIYGTHDGIAAPSAVLANRHLLPPQTRWHALEGANHVQFGYYRHQFGDESATIPRQTQQDQTKQALLQLLSRLEQPLLARHRSPAGN